MRKICAKKLITSQIGRYRGAVVSAAVSLADHANVDHTPTYGTAAVAYGAVLRGVVAAHGYGICAPCGRALLSLFISRISAISCKDRSFLDSRASRSKYCRAFSTISLRAGIAPGRSWIESWTSKIRELARLRTSSKHRCAMRLSRIVMARAVRSVSVTSTAATTAVLCRTMNFDARYHHLEFGAHALGEFEIGVRVVGVGSSHFH